jgi:hypothetical protein
MFSLVRAPHYPGIKPSLERRTIQESPRCLVSTMSNLVPKGRLNFRPVEIYFSVGRDLNGKQAEGKASLYEGHGFSRAVNALSPRGLQPLRYASENARARILLKKKPHLSGLSRPARNFYGTAEPVPFVESSSRTQSEYGSSADQRLRADPFSRSTNLAQSRTVFPCPSVSGEGRRGKTVAAALYRTPL